MLEVVPYNERVTSVKTASVQDGSPIMWVYAYLIDDTLFDAGCANAKDELREFASQHEIKRVFISHTHEDHIGGISAFLPGAIVYAQESHIEYLNDPPSFADFFDFVWGRPDPIKDVHPMPPKFEVGDLKFEVIPLLGHGHGMVGFYEARKRWLFSADGVPLPSKKRIAQDDENVPQILATLEKILSMKIDVLFDGHRGPIESPQSHIQVRIDNLREMQQKVMQLHDDGKTISEILDELQLEGPWYLELTEGRFKLDYIIKSLLFDKSS